MKNTVFAFLLAFAAAGTLWITAPKAIQAPANQENQQLSDRERWNQLFNQRLAEMRSRDDGSSYGEDRPDQAFLFDKIKRMNPLTGEVPEMGLLNAYENIVEQFGPWNPSTESSNNGLWWDERGPTNIGGRTRAILFDPNDATNKAFFAGGVGGGLWYTNDVTVGSPTWTLVSPTFGNVAISCIVDDPSDPQILYYGTGEGYPNADAQRGAGIYKSTDGGASWAVLPSTLTSSFLFVIRMDVDDDGNLYAGTKSGLHKSTDGGATFYEVLGNGVSGGGDNISDVEIATNGDIFVSIDGFGVYKSAASLGANQGEVGQWDHLTTNFTAGYGRIELADAGSNSSVVYALVERAGGVDKVYKTTNGGTSWAATAGQAANGADFSNGQAWYDLDIECSPTDANRVFVGGLNVYRTTNGGTSWSQTTGGFVSPYIHVDQHYITFRPGNPNGVVFSNDGGIWYTADGGASFDDKNSGYNVTQYYAIAVDQAPGSNVVIGGTQDNGTHKLFNPGVSAADDIYGSDGGFCAINHQFGDTMFMTTQYETVARTRNGGNTNTNITNGNLDETNTMFINPLEIDPNNGSFLYQASTSLWRHSNASAGSGSGWSRATSAIGQITAIGISKNTPHLVYVAGGSGVYRIVNANTTNQTFTPPLVGNVNSGYISCISVNPSDGNHIIITYTSYGLTSHVMECRNANMGAAATWKSLQGNLPDLPVNWACFEPNNYNGILLGTDLGVFRCTDITQPTAQCFWTPERNGLGMVRVDMIRPRYSDNMVFIGTHGRGIFSTNSYNLAPQAAFSTLSTQACGGVVQFTDSSANAPNQWAWDFGDGGTSTLQFPTHTYSSSGSYTVQLIVTNPNGSDTTSQMINITVLPGAVAVAGPDLLACSGDTVHLIASGGVSYLWAPGGPLDDPTSATPVATVSGDVNFIVTVTDANGCSDTDTTYVDMQSAPSIWAGQDQTISFPNDSAQLQASGGVSYEWSPTTGLSCTTCSNPKSYVTVNTTYTVTGYNAAGCSRTDQVTVIVDIVGTGNPTAVKPTGLLSTLPNPFSDEVLFGWHLSEPGVVTVELMNVEGRQIATLFTGFQPAGEHHLNWSRKSNPVNIPAGVYFLRMSIGGKSYSQKLMIAD